MNIDWKGHVGNWSNPGIVITQQIIDESSFSIFVLICEKVQQK